MKNSKQNLRYAVTFSFLLSLLAGCESFLEVDLPSSQLTAPAVFEDRATAEAALSGVYAKMRDNGLLSGSPLGLSHQLGNYADELDFYGQPQTSTDYFNSNGLSPGLSDVKNLWTDTYNQIYGANAVLYGAQESTALEEADRRQFRGEALFIRALLHFYLANLYGDVPYITSTDYQANSRASRMPASAVYNAALEDLETAAALLEENYPDAARIRPNRYAVLALTARLQLYRANWEEAAAAAADIIQATGHYEIENDINAVFQKESRSTIWQFSPALASSNTQEGSTFIFTLGPPPLSAISTGLYGSFTPGDLRKSNWTATVTDGASIWYHPSKYKKMLTEGSPSECSIVLRLEEQYLIRAEARAHLGDLAGAAEDLNAIRNRAGLGNTAAMTQSAPEKRWSCARPHRK